MKQNVVLAIRGRQNYEDQEPDVIELTTEGTMEFKDGGWDISYEETALTGLEGVTTLFRVEPDKIILTRTGKLRSEMVFQKGVVHESLYQMDVGTLMIAVCAQKIDSRITEHGGTMDLVYGIDIEQSAGGLVEYHVDIKLK